MNKFAMVFLTAAMTLGSGAVMADQSNNGTANQAADAGASSAGAAQKLAPNGVDNSKINNTGDATTHTKKVKHHAKKSSATETHKNSVCKDGKCPDVNKKVGSDANTKTDGTTQ
ncbi:YbgS-like family protein [Erwinia psidii]|uniref:Homeobox protein YbgS n=1 Tax=Erwinia psidii TaxID=69224 RepID=A0A3N6SFJ7_9GAMM|nr:YbgS-like family protein [Erwinia psidii]MCX8957187.1 homeobox protein YbgS [Erwinia psidii]MCX8961839.1 homeobox protein YbgS [Erwinia psidii]MCX8965433.1 homeobox protein YbgS [Erwinia psidii]RQM37441.1 homeobox protein YbgS [Erwinia psidii]